MSAKAQSPKNDQDTPSPTTGTPSDPNPNAQDASSAPDDNAEAQPASPETQPPIDDETGENVDGELPLRPAPEAALQPRRKKPASPRRARTNKTAGADKPSADEPAAGSHSWNHKASDEERPALKCLQGGYIEPAPSPPVGTLPQELETLFPDMLSISVLLATTAAAGAGLQLENGETTNSEGGSIALRVAVVGEERNLPRMPVAMLLRAAYALEARDVLRWSEAKQRADMESAPGVALRRLYRQALASAGILGAGLSGAVALTLTPTPNTPPKPCFVLRDPVQTAVKRGLEAASRGILVVDGRRMPTMAGFGVNYDGQSAQLLNDAAAGRALELSDPQTEGSVQMRPVAASVIGTLSIGDSFGIYKAGPDALAATLLVPAPEKTSSEPPADSGMIAFDILARVRLLTSALEDNQPPLRLSATARKALNQARLKYVHASHSMPRPVSQYYTAAADLVRRVAVGLHVLDHAVRKAEKMSVEVGKEVVLRAIDFVEQCALSSARNILAPASVGSTQRDATRILSFAQQRTSRAYPELARRDVIRSFQRTMSVAAVDQAIRLLVADELLAAPTQGSPSGGQVFQVHEAVFMAEHQLPDLVTDPRRPRQ